ncbi:MAG TPA: chlorite dismutase family protein [Gaiellaceae bacterium]|nr:chlorite dismutase family protein [Gaiellaceae bacterium]
MNELYRYLTIAVTPEWRRLPEEERASQKRDLLRAADMDGTTVHAYSLVGTRVDADLLLWIVAEDLEQIRALETRLAATRLWTYSTRPYGYLAARRRSPYLGDHAHADSEQVRTDGGPLDDKAYVFIYPMIKKRSWYSLPHEERTRIMAKHFEVGHRYPDIRIHTGYSFGIDDHEFVVAFEGDDPRLFLSLVADLRETESSAYTETETPIFVGATMSLERALDQIDGAEARAGALA